MKRVENYGNTADALTGERIAPTEMVYDTGLPNKSYPYQRGTKTLILKEETIVWLAEEAGLIVKRDAGDSGDAEVVDGTDVGVGGGEASVGEVEVGGRKSSKRRSGGASSGE